MSSFDNGQTVSVSISQLASSPSRILPYNPDLKFNKVIGARNPKGASHVINVDKMLRVANGNDLSELYQITLAGRPAHQGVALWDAMFNSTPYRPSTAVLFVAQNNFQPLSQDRIVSRSHFLDYSRHDTRTYLNRIAKGDQIGIAISDPMSGYVYVFLYEAEDPVWVRTKIGDGDDVPTTTVPCINVTMHHALRLNHDDLGEATVTKMGEREYDHEAAGGFVSQLVDSVLNIDQGFPWKPHFLPQSFLKVDRAVTEERLKTGLLEVRPVAYNEFLDMCQLLYRQAKHTQPKPEPVAKPAQSRGRFKKPERQTVLPVVEVMTQGTTFYATVPGQETMVSFTLEDMGQDAQRERFLTNRDLKNTLVKENSNVVILSEEFGENAYLRGFSVNF
jgi:hypothetical protein